MSFADLEAANASFAAAHGNRPLSPLRPQRGLAVVMCMDPRTEPLQALGLALDEAGVLRNAGGRVTPEVLADLILGVHRFAVDRILVLQHTDCGLTKASSAQLQAAIAEGTGLDASGFAWGTMAAADQPSALAADVALIRASPFIPAEVAVVGAILDLGTGRLTWSADPA